MPGPTGNDSTTNTPGPSRNGEHSSATPVAQLVEQRIPNPQVAGSSPSRRASDDDDSGPGLGLHKFGQGYWVRVMTAVLSGVMVLSFAGWSWSQLEAVRIPTPRWTLGVGETAGGFAPAPGQAVNLESLVTGIPVTLGTAEVESSDLNTRGTGTVVIGKLALVDAANPQDIGRVSPVTPVTPVTPATPGTPAAGAPALLMSGQPLGIPLFQRIWLQAGVAGLITLVGAGVIYRLVGTRPSSVDFLVATDGEMKKVNWSTRKVIIDSTWVVIGATFLIAFIIFMFDFGLQAFFRLIRVLDY